tara:strand:+ start:747 stop:1088 length:342 start_codon:yes stop_codon:yes gene_type:complete
MNDNAKNIATFGEKTFEAETAQWTIEKLIKEINNLEQLKTIKDIINKKFEIIAQAEGSMLNIGDLVKVTGSNRLEQGTVIKVNRTRAVIDVEGRNWTVPFSMLTKMEINHDDK